MILACHADAGCHFSTHSAAHSLVLALWQILQALGEPNRFDAAGLGGLIEWSLRFMRPNAVMGMWQSTHVGASGFSLAWCECAPISATRSA
jgi:hypothetical protein